MVTRVMVQHRDTKAYLDGNDQWISTDESARLFDTSLQALRFCVEKKLRNTEVVVCFPDDRIVRFPLA